MPVTCTNFFIVNFIYALLIFIIINIFIIIIIIITIIIIIITISSMYVYLHCRICWDLLFLDSYFYHCNFKLKF